VKLSSSLCSAEYTYRSVNLWSEKRKRRKTLAGNSWQGQQIPLSYWISTPFKMKPFGTNQCINNSRHDATNTWPAVGNSCKRQWGMHPTLSERLLGCRGARGKLPSQTRVAGAVTWAAYVMTWLHPLAHHTDPRLENTYIAIYLSTPIWQLYSTGTGTGCEEKKNSNERSASCNNDNDKENNRKNRTKGKERHIIWKEGSRIAKTRMIKKIKLWKK
jgi:hypothetical protein